MNKIKLKHIDLNISYNNQFDYEVYVFDNDGIFDIELIKALGEYFKIYHNATDIVITVSNDNMSIYFRNDIVKNIIYNITDFYLIDDILYTELTVDEYKQLERINKIKKIEIIY